jgi:hypothetical protein
VNKTVTKGMTEHIKVGEVPYLIVGGTTKAATTSLYYYLANHPGICAANLKETRFFLDADYPLPSKYRFEDGLHRYAELFGHCRDARVRMEATPDYMYSAGTARKISDSLPFAKIVFVLREPVSRLLSWYRFAVQTGFYAPAGFDAYVREQADGTGPRPQHMLALEQGKYSAYLSPYYELLGKDRVFVLWYEDLRERPAEAMGEICKFANVDPGFYDGYEFMRHNETLTMRSPRVQRLYMSLRRHVRYRVADRTRIRRILRSLRAALDPLYLRLNTKSKEAVEPSRETMDFLGGYYAEEADALHRLTGRRPPWPQVENSFNNARRSATDSKKGWTHDI